MDFAFDPQTITKDEFDKILQQTFANLNDYEKQSIMVILNMFNEAEGLKENKLRMTKYLVGDIDKLLKLVRLSNGKKEDIESIINEIKALQSNIARYMETSDEDVLESIKRNINEINVTNKRLIENKQEYVSKDEKKEKEDLKTNELRYLNERQNKLHQKLDAEIEKELKKLNSKIKPFDFKKLDKAYRHLYEALDSDNQEEIINKRGRLIRLLEANKEKLAEQYKEVKALEDIKEVFESEEAQEIKEQRINEILRRPDNSYSLYFSNVNNYDELRKEFYNLYEFLEVNKTRLYKEALREELKRHGTELKEAYSHELIDKKHQASVLTQALPMTLGLSIQKFSNTMGELRNATTDRQKAELRKEAIADVGRILATPVANVAKFAANNWYTLSLLHKGYKTAKEQAEQPVQTEQEEETPKHHGAEYDDPEFEEEVIRLMKTGKYQSVDEAEHQALINLGRIPPDEPDAPQETDLEVGDPDQDLTEPEVEQPEPIETHADEPPALSSTKQGLSEAEIGATVVLTSSQNPSSVYVAVKNESGTFDVTEYQNGVVVCTYTGMQLRHFGDTFTIVDSDALPSLLAEAGLDQILNNDPNQNPSPIPDPAADVPEDNTPQYPPASEKYPELVDAQMSRILPASPAFNGNIYEQLQAGLIDGDSPVKVWYFLKGETRWPWNEHSITITMREAQELFNWCTEVDFDEYQVGVGHLSK